MIFQNNSCLLLIDIQQDYKDIYNFIEFKNNIIQLLNKARKENILICFIYQVDTTQKSYWLPFWKELKGDRNMDKGKPFEFSKPKYGEYFFIKNTNDAFFETGLNIFLKQHKIDTLYICGLLTSICVLNSVFSAYNNGYRVHLIDNCCSDRNKKKHHQTIKNYSNHLFINENI